MATPVLYHIEVSHYNEKARWALDYKGVPHRRKAPMPMAHMAWAMAMTRGQSKTFPILRMNGDTVHDSTKIIERLERDYPEPPLYPDDPDDRRRALELEEFFDEELAPHIRRAAFAEVTRDPDAFAWIAAPRAGQARARRFQGDGGRRGTADPHALRDQRARPRSMGREKTVAAFERLESEIGPSGYLVGDSFTVADLTAAAAVLPARAAAGVRAPHARRAPRAAHAMPAESWGTARAGSGCGRCIAATAAPRPKSHRLAACHHSRPMNAGTGSKEAPLARAPAERRQARAGARHHARGERRPGGLGARAGGLSPHRQGADRRLHRSSGRRQEHPDRVARRARPGEGPRGGRAVDRPLQPLHRGSAARRSHPARRTTSSTKGSTSARWRAAGRSAACRRRRCRRCC